MDDTQPVVLATNNAKKLEELRRLLRVCAPQVRVLGRGDVVPYPEPAETELTFEGNALLKARAALDATGLVSLADDSGLAVDVLLGMPGVRSARWAGLHATDEDNLELLVRQLDDVPEDRRWATFVCAVALVLPGGTSHVRRGEVRGQLLREPKGHHGFGYDPLFVAEGHRVTNAELSPADKDAISHRGQAMRAIVPVLAAHLHSTQPADRPHEEDR